MTSVPRVLVPLAASAALALAAAPSVAAPRAGLARAVSGDAGPALVVDPPVLELGEVYLGHSVTGRVVLANAGDAPLRIEEIDTSCGCTVAALPEASRRLAPGASVELPVTMTPKNGRSPLEKSVRIRTDDPDAPLTVLRVSTVVHTGVHAVPPYVLFLDAEPGAALEQTLELASGDGEPFRVESIRSDGGLYEVEFDPDREALSHAVVVRVPRVPDAVPPTERLVVSSSHPRTPRVEVNATLHLAPRVETSAMNLSFGTIGPEGSATLPLVVVERASGAPVDGVRLEQSRYDDVAIETRRDASDPRLWHVTLRVPPGRAGQRLVTGARLVTDLEDPQPTVLVVSASRAGGG